MFTRVLAGLNVAAEFCSMLFEIVMIAAVLLMAAVVTVALFAVRFSLYFVPRRDEVAEMFAIALGPFAKKVAANVGGEEIATPATANWGQKSPTIRLAEATADGGVAVVAREEAELQR